MEKNGKKMLKENTLANLLVILQNDYNKKKSILKSDSQKFLEANSTESTVQNNEPDFVDEYREKLQNLLKELYLRPNY